MSRAHARAALATIPALVARKWCIDEARIYLTGQSDGGMAADAIAFLAKTQGTDDAIAPSAAGVNGKDLAEYGTICGWRSIAFGFGHTFSF